MTSKRKILSIDGGGIKGVLPIAFLAKIEAESGKRIIDYFDLISGTSTGGIIALGLGLGLSASELLAFYEEKGPKIFDQEKSTGPKGWLTSLLKRHGRSARQFLAPKYYGTELQTALSGVFAERILGESYTRLLIPAFNPHRREVHVFKTAHHPRFRNDWKEKVVDVALSTAAAPTYFPTHELDNGIFLLDGGIWANNPTGTAVVEAIGVLGWNKENLHVLSLGCTDEIFEFPTNSGKLKTALKVADIFMLGQSSSSMGTAKLLMGETNIEGRLIRLDHIAQHNEFGLDSIDKISVLKGIGMSLAREHFSRIDSIFLDEPRSSFEPFYS